MSATESHSEPQLPPDGNQEEEWLTIERPVGTRVIVENELTGDHFEAEVGDGGVIRETDSQEPIDAEDKEVVRTKSPFNQDGDWHFWEKDENGDPVPPEIERQEMGHGDLDGVDKMQTLAFQWLKENAPKYCPISLEEHDEKIELDEAYAFPPRVDGRMDVEYEHRFEPRPHRVNEERGFIPTGPIIGNRPEEEFMIDVWSVLEGAVLVWENTQKRGEGIDYETAEMIWDRALELKRDGGPHDHTIMAKIAAWISDPQLLEFEQ